ncbi:MAG TPA: amidase family protein, partial [Candidatus Acidoferrales bacterium]|nr:amidase family protein [Candidatus Acidoferrales bacterium]
MPTPVSHAPSELCFLSAIDLAGLIRSKMLSARDLMQACLMQIERLNGRLNAIVTLVPEDELMARALAADEAIAHKKSLGPLHGLPIGVKDLLQTKGIRTTSGSPLFKDFLPDSDCLVVEREKLAGAIVIGKTNVPEFGLGSQTFNKVFGATLNPY